MNQATQDRILAMIGGTSASQLAASAPSTSVLPGADGRISVTTSLAGIPLTVTATGGTATMCDAGDPATLVGSALTVDANVATLPVTIDLCVTRATAGSVSLAVEATSPDIPNLGYTKSPGFVGGGGTNVCQIFSYTIADSAPLSVSATMTFAAAQTTTTTTAGTTTTTSGGATTTTAAGATTMAESSTTSLTSTTLAGDRRSADETGVVRNSDARLAMTGSTTSTLVTLGVATALAGFALVLIRRRRAL